MTVSHGGPSQTSGAAKTLPSRVNSPSAAYANVLNTASGDQQSGMQARLGATPGTRSEKAQLARQSTSGVVRSMSTESHQATSSNRSSGLKSSSAYHQARNDGGAHQGKTKKQAGCGDTGAAKKKEGSGEAKAPGQGSKATSTHDKASMRQGGNPTGIADKKAAQGAGKPAQAGMAAAKDVSASAFQGKASSLGAKTPGKGADAPALLAKAQMKGDNAAKADSRLTSSRHDHAAQQQRSPQSAGAHQNHQGPLVDAALQQPGVANQPLPQQHVTPNQGHFPLHVDQQHHHGGLGVAGHARGGGGGLGLDHTPLGQSILSLLFGMQNVESDSGRCAMAEQACNSCSGGEGGGSESDFAGGTSSLEQLLQSLKELVGRSVRISGGEKYEIFGLIDRFLTGRTATG